MSKTAIKSRISVVILLLRLLFPIFASAQSDFDFTQRWFNQSIYNPAATGNTFSAGVYMHGRVQWVGLEGAPTTEAVCVDYYNDDLNSGFGITVTGDQIGFTQTYAGKISYSYYLPVSRKSYLSIGLAASFVNRTQNAYGALVDQLDDPDLYYGTASTNSPSFDFGLEYAGPLKIGVSIRHLGPGSASPYFKTLSNNIWAYASAGVNVGNLISLEPLVSYMYRERFNRIEAGVIVHFSKYSKLHVYNDNFWLGGIYRFHGQFGFLAGVNLTKNLRAGYSFDYGLGDLSLISRFGTHEIFIAWQLNRIFYRDPECPAFKRGRNDKNKRKFIEKISKRFEVY